MTETLKPSIEAVLVHYGAEYVPGGHGWRAMRCPFHDDRNASAGVNHEADSFSCHACDVSGDSLALIMQREGIDFRAALEFGKGLDPDYRPEQRPRRGGRPTVTRRWSPPGRRGRKSWA